MAESLTTSPGAQLGGKRALVAPGAAVYPHLGEGSPQFGADTWDLSALTPTMRSKGVLRFEDVPEEFRPTLKELCYALLNHLPEPRARTFKPTSVRGYLDEYKALVRWLAGRGVLRLSEVTQEDLDTYLRSVAALPHRSGPATRTAGALQALYRYRAFLSSDTLTFAPWHGQHATKTTGTSRSREAENTTPRLPEEVSGPLLDWALFYVQTVGDEIVAQVRGAEWAPSEDPLTGKPWRVRAGAYKRVKSEEETLRTACMIVVLFLTGMRFQEALSIRRDCTRLLRDVPGGIPVYELKGRTFKSVPSPHGKEVTWVTVEPVHQAVQLLSALTTESEHIFARRRIEDPQFFNSYHMSVSLAAFQRHVNQHHANETRTGIPTREDGTPHPITSRQFRRTLAAYIAAKPFGVVAGMVQYKHLHVATFEGYAGTSESGFALEVKQEQELAAYEDVVAVYEQTRAGAPAAGQHHRQLERDVATFGGSVVDEQRLEVMARSKARTLHRGELNDCFYDPAKALCRAGLQKALSSGDAPLLSRCSPLECSCSHIGPDKLPAWEALQEEWETVAQGATSPVQVAQAGSQVELARSVVVTLRHRDGKEVEL